jgi:N-acetylmuramoyl-L-alanine amidase
MPMWSDLDRAFEGSGLVVKVGYSNWRNYGHGTPGKAECVACHHTAGPPTGDTPSLNTVIYGRSDLPGPLCNLYLSRSGQVYLVAAGIGYHAGNTRQPWQDNDSAIGIEAEATGVDPWPQSQWDAYARMCACLAHYYRIPVDRVMGHKEICEPPGRKIDPNFDMNKFRQAVGTGGNVPAQAARDFPDDEENQMLIFFDTVDVTPPDPPDPEPEPDPPHVEHHATPVYEYRFHGQRTCEAGGGSNIAQSAWACFSVAWGGCKVYIAANDGKGRVWNLLGAPGKLAGVANNAQIPFPLPSGARMVTIEGLRDGPGTVVACDVYNLR